MERVMSQAGILGSSGAAQFSGRQLCSSSLRCNATHSRSLMRPSRRAQRHGLLCTAASDVSLFTDSSLSGPGLGLSGPGASSKRTNVRIEDIALDSEAGMDYTKLRDLLAEQKFEEADDETRALLIKLAGPGAVDRKWVYFTEVKFIPAQDLRVIDGLWRAGSGNKFGYSVQKDVWVQNRRYWERLFKAIDWVQGEYNMYRKWPTEFNYSTDAPKGHLPLTNCLRGTQLFKAILEHPAFERPSGEGAEASNGDSPAWLNETETKFSL